MIDVSGWIIVPIVILLGGLIGMAVWPASATELRDQHDSRHPANWYPTRIERFKTRLERVRKVLSR